MPALFTPFTLKGITLRNRIAVPPMCQYSAVNGFTNDWHRTHYLGMARGGAGLVIVEATAVSEEGRITPSCTGLWEDAQIDGMASIASGIQWAGAVPGIQIGHAGRKASANSPWEGDQHIPEGDPRSWQPLAPSAIAYGGGLPRVPKAMSLDVITRVKAEFVSAARRALSAGFKWLELHYAHGYLAQSFFSSHSNLRTDQYGGSFENRARFLLETLAAVREVWPDDLPLSARLGVIEYDGRAEETVSESIELARRMRALGLDFLNVSVNFVIPDTKIPWATEAFLAPIAQRVRIETGLPVASAWGMDAAQTADRLISSQQLDLVMMVRAHLTNPHYAYQLAKTLEKPDPESVLPEAYSYWLQRYRGAAKSTA